METRRAKCERRLQGLKNIRSDYEYEVREIARFAQPARSRFMFSETNTGARRRNANKKLLNSHGIEAFRTLTNGLTSGLSSNSRPWFSLTVEDDDLAQDQEVKIWLADVERRMYAFMAKTNLYGALKSGYGEMGLFGTEATVAVEHPLEGMVCHSLTFGEYWIALSDAMVPDTLYRMCPMSVKQAVDTFGDAVSRRVRTLYDNGSYDHVVDIYHAIEPNSDYDPTRLGSKRFSSIYWESNSDRDSLLSENGYDEQPFWAPRWDVTGGDVYGYSPGMEALPALRELQMQTKRRNEAIDMLVHPEKIVPENVRLTGQPRNIVTVANIDRDSVIVPYQLPPVAVDAISQEVEKCKTEISSLSYADLFKAITNMRGIQPRNIEEIAARNEEKLTQLGPVIERVSNEKLEVVIDRVFGIMTRGNLLPDPPEQLADVNLKVEFVSILAQMQRMVGIGQIERTASFIGNLAGAIPDVLDKLNGDEVVDEYASRAGAPVKIIRGKAEVEELRAARAQQQQQQQALQALPAVKDGADAARLLSETDVGGSSALNNLLGV